MICTRGITAHFSVVRMQKMKLKRWEIALILAVIAVFVCGFGIRREAGELSDKLVRLHVVANSDSESDQALKLRVRDAVLSCLRPRLKSAADAAEAREIIADSLPDIKSAAEAETERSGGQQVAVTLCMETFPTREYDTFSLPAGEYLSLRIKLGEAQGHNWWCVVFPPICDAGVIDDDTAAAIGLSEEETRLITQSGTGYVIKFRLIELLSALFGR